MKEMAKLRFYDKTKNDRNREIGAYPVVF